MANACQAAKSVPHTVTSADIAAFGFLTPIFWPAPFADTNYGISFTIELVKAGSGTRASSNTDGSAYYPVNVVRITPAQCSVEFRCWAALVGDVVRVHAIGNHK